jgi:hypothetical protein
MFKVDKLVKFARKEIAKFSKSHQDETFYAFAIDANMLCLNSEECFERTLSGYVNDCDFRNRHIENWTDMTETDMDAEEVVLDLGAKYSGLDLDDKDACLKLINERGERNREKGNPYRLEEHIKDLRENTGDWDYQGFTEFSKRRGFDEDA